MRPIQIRCGSARRPGLQGRGSEPADRPDDCTRVARVGARGRGRRRAPRVNRGGRRGRPLHAAHGDGPAHRRRGPHVLGHRRGPGGGTLLLLYVLFFDRGGSGWWIVTAIAMIVVGFVLLVLRGGTERDPFDDGTRV